MQSGVLLYSVELKKETHMQFLTLSISLGIITLITACGEAPVSSSTNQPEKTEEAPPSVPDRYRSFVHVDYDLFDSYD